MSAFRLSHNINGDGECSTVAASFARSAAQVSHFGLKVSGCLLLALQNVARKVEP